MSAAHSPFCEINNISTTQEIPHILYEQNVRYRIHKCQICLYPEPIQYSTVHVLQSDLFKIYFNIILPLTFWFSK